MYEFWAPKCFTWCMEKQQTISLRRGTAIPLLLHLSQPTADFGYTRNWKRLRWEIITYFNLTEGPDDSLLQERVCYFDTDSVIYLTNPGDTYHPKLGSWLGEMTDEIEEYLPGAKMDTFVSVGPKNYGYRVKKQEGNFAYKIKIRGFRLQYAASQQLNLKTLKKKVAAFVKRGDTSKIGVTQPQITRSCNRQVTTRDTRKQYGVVYKKRRLLSDYNTLPFGTCK